MDASRGEREMLAAMTEMLLFIQEDPRTGRGFFLCRRDIGDSTVVSPFFLFPFFSSVWWSVHHRAARHN
jgi:hypothetical protein